MFTTQEKNRREHCQKLLLFIDDYIQQHGFPPNIREMMHGCGYKTTSNVHYYLTMLEDRGLIARNKGCARNIRLLPTFLSGPDETAPYTPARADAWQAPLLGPIQAGAPLPLPEGDPAIFDAHTTVTVLSAELPYHPDLFAVRVQGDSMVDALVGDGDLLLLQRTALAQNGDMVAALLNGATTLKLFYREDSRILLQPANPHYRPILIRSTDAFQIQGIVVRVLRRFH